MQGRFKLYFCAHKLEGDGIQDEVRDGHGVGEEAAAAQEQGDCDPSWIATDYCVIVRDWRVIAGRLLTDCHLIGYLPYTSSATAIP